MVNPSTDCTTYEGSYSRNGDGECEDYSKDKITEILRDDK